jgi:TRAP-type mannitol/chloroaromatic compound transport system permease small subunit
MGQLVTSAGELSQRAGLRQIGRNPGKSFNGCPQSRGPGRGEAVNFLLALSRAIDALNRRIGHAVCWLVLAAVLVSAGNAVSRYLFDLSSNAWLELQWYLFSAVFLLAAGYTLLHNEHVRIDVVFGHLPPRLRAWIDLIGGVFFLLPMAVIIMALSWPVFVDSYQLAEYSSDAGGLLRWPVKLLIPVGFLLLAVQGVSEIIKRAAFLLGRIPDPLEKHHEPVAEEQLRGSVS